MPFETLNSGGTGARSTSGHEAPLVQRPKNVTNGSSSDTRASSNSVNGIDSRFRFLRRPQQDALLLHGPGEYYTLERGQEIPEPKSDAELLVQVLAIGLNPVDWKGADYDFSQPSYPWINGRDFAGLVVRAPRNSASRIQLGNVVFGSSTDYRDIRKAAFQEYVIANDYNVSRIPDDMSITDGAALGVGFTAAVIALGVSFGIDFGKLRNVPKGPDLLSQVRMSHPNDIPEDIRDEVVNGISTDERPKPGEWIALWGAGVAGQFFLQLAKFAGLKVACVEDLNQNGEKLANLELDFMIDYKDDPNRVVEILRAVTGGKLRFGVDTVGKKTAESLQTALQKSDNGSAHLAGLCGLPDDAAEGVVHHKHLPLKLFHELPGFGESISKWFEDLLLAKSVTMPEVEIAETGLSSINEALDRLRRNEVPGKRIVVPIRSEDSSNSESTKA